jgi:predicted enzyme related to lactoylglutathione lyase
MPNPFVHAELASTDVRKSKAFYGKLFKWKLESMSMPHGFTYTMIDVGDGVGGGMMKQMIPGAGSAWLPYVHVTDVAAAAKKAKKLGAVIRKDKTEVKGMGWYSIITDPTGACLGLWEPKG